MCSDTCNMLSIDMRHTMVCRGGDQAKEYSQQLSIVELYPD